MYRFSLSLPLVVLTITGFTLIEAGSVDMVSIPGGWFTLGTNDVESNRNQDGEAPARRVELNSFEIDATPVRF